MANDCFNGCGEIHSEKCIKYVGEDQPKVEVSKGDSYHLVMGQVLTYLQSVMTGEGVNMDIAVEILCDAIKEHLPTDVNTASLVDYITALVKLSCENSQLSSENKVAIDKIEADYVVGCLVGDDPESVPVNSGTHNVLQLTLNLLCETVEKLDELKLQVEEQYVKKTELDKYFKGYLASSGEEIAFSTNMVPNTVVEYYGDLTNFDADGVGSGQWENIYLCNGKNGTPDKRGRVGVGVVTDMRGDTMSPAIDPAVSPLNTDYQLGNVKGANGHTLTEQEIAVHSHIITPQYLTAGSGLPAGDPTGGPYLIPGSAAQESTSSTGNSVAHNNVQPVLACYYIMYIPA